MDSLDMLACLRLGFLHLHHINSILSPARLRSGYSSTKPGLSVSKGRWVNACFRPAGGRGNHTAPGPVLVLLQQILPEQSISHQLRRLTVRPLTDPFDLKANKPPGGTEICRKVTATARGMPLFPQRSIYLTSQKEISVTKEQIDALLKWLGEPGVGMNDVDAIHKLQLTRRDAPPMSVILASLCVIQY